MSDSQDKKRVSEAQSELERLYGPKELENLSTLQRFKLSLIQNQYRKETYLFRIFFDKLYRPERYNIIMNKMEDFKNINEFRTFVMQKHNSFPLRVVDLYSFFPKLRMTRAGSNDVPPIESRKPLRVKATDYKVDEEQKQKDQEQQTKKTSQKDIEIPNKDLEEQTSNILHEKQFLNIYTNVYKLEMFLYFVLGNMFLYLSLSLATRTFNRAFMLRMLVPSLIGNMSCIYARTLKYREFEANLSGSYKDELKKYRRFFHDEGYD